MRTIAKLFGKSPFSPLQIHMDRVSECILLLEKLLDALTKQEFEKVKKLSKEISNKEHIADLTRNDLRNNLSKNLFMPIDKASFLEILNLQDSFANKAEDIAILATLKNLKHLNELDNFESFYKKNIETFKKAHLIIKEFDSLLESSFGGLEARKVKDMIEELSLMEHELDILGYDILKKLYTLTDKISYSSFHLLNTLLKAISQISNIAEKLGNKIRTILEIK
jgi:hypothetical protein